MAEIDTIKVVLSEKGMRPGETHTWQNVEYFWADQIYSKTGVVFAKYLLLPLSLDEWEEFLLSDEQFSAEVIEKTYYLLHSDLCWNLYLVCVLSDEDFEQIDLHTRFELERNTNYIRKIVLKESELGARLPVGNTLLRADDQPLVQPEQEWRKILKEEYEFCLDSFQSAGFESIASGISPCKKGVSNIPPVPLEKIYSVHSIHIPEDFRPHFYNNDINLSFPKANLLSGTNGAGKTSVFSAIELAMTGTVRKQHPVPEDPADQAEVSLMFDTNKGEIEVHKVLTAQKKKQREAKWYKNRAENRTADQLNTLFHRFNYFSVDDTYLFTSEQPDHSIIFSKILYGPETAAKWKNIKVWREKCEQESSQLCAEMKRIDELLQKPSSVQFIDESSLRSYIRRSGLNIAPDASYSQIAGTLGEIQAELNQAEACKPILSRSMLEVEKRNTEQQLLDLREQTTVLQEQFKKCNNDYETLNIAIRRNENRLKFIKRQKEILSPLEELLPVLKIKMDKYEVFLSFQKQQQKLEELEKNFDRLQVFWDEYHDLLAYSSLPDLDAQWEDLKAKQANLKLRSSQVESQINEAEMHVELGKKLLNQLRSIGKEIVQEIPSLHQCPLCGTKDIEAKVILNHLNQEQEISSEELSRLYQKRQQLEGERLQLDRQWEALCQLGKTADTVASAFATAHDLFPKVSVGEPLETVKRVLEEIQQQKSRKDQLQEFLEREKKRIKAKYIPKQSEISVEDVLNVEDRVRELLLRNKYTECENLSGSMLPERVLDILRRLDSEKEELESDIINKKTERDALPFENLAKQQNERFGQLNALENDETRWKQMVRFWENISEWVLSEAVDLDGAALKMHCEKISNDVKNITEYATYQQKHEELNQRKTQIEQKYQNYQKVVKRLEGLRELESYSQEFIQQNIEQISRIFLSLHQPQEFSGLVMEGKELVGLRGGKKVPVVNMSTGQRTALVLSVFFQMHLSNSVAPQFLLIDEPVANIDELNVLSLMDFLREMVVSHGRQIFFTTASRNVAQLFRRKFSFLKEDFQRLNFLRKSTEELKISQITYDQEKVMLRKNIL